jgi:hypothetical protein
MMDLVENGMVVGAEREWERLNADTPADKATVRDFDRFAWDYDMIADVLVSAFGLADGDLDEEVAKCIYSGLPGDYASKLISDWSSRPGIKQKYNRMMEDC